MARALGRYELLRPLARGGMAEVYLARRRAAGVEKWLVVKRMRPERSGDPRFLDLFVREARLSMSLVHQNIVPVFDFGRIDDQVFLAMERVEGKDLGSSLARAAANQVPPLIAPSHPVPPLSAPSHPVPPLIAAFIAAECCQALAYAHQRKGPDGVALGIVHRDVTPRNVLLSWSGEVKLTDFGIAALAGEATSRLLGTPQYMAPEQARSEPIDPRADIYSIGLVLREAVSGARPRPGADRDTILEAARRGALLPWPHLADPACDPAGATLALGSGDHSPPAERASEPPPAALMAIIERATAAAPDDRYPDARSMLEELDSFIVGQRAAHRAESPARQLAAWLAAVWEGARDDVESDAAIEGDHLVSFLDDGAFDVIGTGTARSLAATAADDTQLAHVVGSIHGGPDSPSPATASSEPPVADRVAAASARAADPAARPGRISSSIARVASGSFHSIPAPSTDPGASDTAGPRRRKIPPFASVLVVGVVVGAALFLVANRYRDPQNGAPPNGTSPNATLPNAASPNAAPPNGTSPNATSPNATSPNAASQNAASQNAASPNAAPPNAAPPNAAPPNAASPNAASPNAASPNAASPNAASPNAASPNAASPNAASPTSGQRDTGHPDAGQSLATRPGLGQPSSGQATTAPPTTTPPKSGRDGSPSTAPTSASGGPRPALCRVRINLTPWAYYTADEDTTRHETPGTIDLTPGQHLLHVWNPELHIERDITITVPADRDTMNYSEPLQPATILRDR